MSLNTALMRCENVISHRMSRRARVGSGDKDRDIGATGQAPWLQPQTGLVSTRSTHIPLSTAPTSMHSTQMTRSTHTLLGKGCRAGGGPSPPPGTWCQGCVWEQLSACGDPTSHRWDLGAAPQQLPVRPPRALPPGVEAATGSSGEGPPRWLNVPRGWLAGCVGRTGWMGLRTWECLGMLGTWGTQEARRTLPTSARGVWKGAHTRASRECAHA